MATGDNDGSSGAALLNQPIVMDVGTDTTKAGFAGGQTPKVRSLGVFAIVFWSYCSTMSNIYTDFTDAGVVIKMDDR